IVTIPDRPDNPQAGPPAQARATVVVVAFGRVVVVGPGAGWVVVVELEPSAANARLAAATNACMRSISRAYPARSPALSAAFASSDARCAPASSCATVALGGGCPPVCPVAGVVVVVVVEPLPLLLFPLTWPLS